MTETKVAIIYIPGISSNFLKTISTTLTPILTAAGIQPIFTTMEFQTMSINQLRDFNFELGQILDKMEKKDDKK